MSASWMTDFGRGVFFMTGKPQKPLDGGNLDPFSLRALPSRNPRRESTQSSKFSRKTEVQQKNDRRTADGKWTDRQRMDGRQIKDG